MLFGQREGFIVGEAGMFDGIHARPDRILDAPTFRERARRHANPTMWASSTKAFISTNEYCCPPTVSVFDRTPPVPQNLMTSAPYLRSLRTMARISSGPLAMFGVLAVIDGGNSVLSQWPPVAPDRGRWREQCADQG